MNSNKEQPFFSVIIPTYNREKLLPIAINSVLAQIYTNFELIIVDDGSNDNTPAIMASYDDARINYFYQSNKGNGAARNTGLDNAKGQYICFLDSDDYYLENHLQVLYDTIANEDYPVAIFRTGMYTQNKKDILRKTVLYSPQKHKSAFLFFWHHYTGINSLCLARQIIEKYRFQEQFLLNEDGLYEAMISCNYKLIQIKTFTTVAIYHEHSLTGIIKEKDEITKDLEKHLDSLEWLMKQKNECLVSSLHFNKVAFTRLVYAHKYLTIGAHQQAIKLLLQNKWSPLRSWRLLRATLGVLWHYVRVLIKHN